MRKFILVTILTLTLGAVHAQSFFAQHDFELGTFKYHVFKLGEILIEVQRDAKPGAKVYDSSVLIARDADFKELARRKIPFPIWTAVVIDDVLYCFTTAGDSTSFEKYQSVVIKINRQLEIIQEKEIVYPDSIGQSYLPGGKVFYDHLKQEFNYAISPYDFLNGMYADGAVSFIKLDQNFEVTGLFSEEFIQNQIFTGFYESEYGFIISTPDSIYGLSDDFKIRSVVKRIKTRNTKHGAYELLANFITLPQLLEDSNYFYYVAETLLDSVVIRQGQMPEFNKSQSLTYFRQSKQTGFMGPLQKLVVEEGFDSGYPIMNSQFVNNNLYVFGFNDPFKSQTRNILVLYKLTFDQGLLESWSSQTLQTDLNEIDVVYAAVTHDESDLFGIYQINDNGVGKDTYFHFKSDVSSGFGEFDSQKELLLYPNPANQKVNLNTGERVISQVKFYDSLGRVVLRDSGSEINVSSLSPGIYTVVIDVVGAASISEKLMIR